MEVRQTCDEQSRGRTSVCDALPKPASNMALPSVMPSAGESDLLIARRIPADVKKISTRNQQAHVSPGKEENTQALVVQTNVAKPQTFIPTRSGEEERIEGSVSVTEMDAALKRVEKLELSSNDQHQADEGERELVLTLDQSDFSETISKHDFVVVIFYSPWNDECKAYALEFEKTAVILSGTHPGIILAKVDFDANQELANEHATYGVFTLTIFRDGGKTVHTYEERRDAEGMAEYLKKQSGPASAEIKSVEDATGLIGENSLILVGVFPKFSGKEYDNFIALAKELRSDYEFAHTLDAKLLPRGDTSVSGPLVRLFKPFDQLFVDSMDFNVEGLEKFLEESSWPLLTLLNNDPMQRPYTTKFFTHQDAKVMLFMNFNNEVAESMKAKYREVAEQSKGEGIKFLLGDLDEASQMVLKYLGIKAEHAPLIVAASNDERLYGKGNIVVDDIALWVKDYKDGKVALYRRSQRIPHGNGEPVKVVVADNIDDFVFKSGKNVLIDFYEPTCGHCIRFAPILNEVALSFESDPNIVIAKFDILSNDIPSDALNVKNCHTLYFRSSTGTILPYNGDKTKEDMIDYIEKNRAPCSVMTSLVEKGSSSQQQEVYRVVNCGHFQKITEISRELLHIKPARLDFKIEWQKPSSTSFVLSNKTDHSVAFRISQSKMQIFTVTPNKGLLKPRSTCQVTVIMKAQSAHLQEGDKFVSVRSVKAKNDSSSSETNIPAMSENAIDKWIMKVFYDAPPELDSVSSVPDHRAQLISKGFLRGSEGVIYSDTHPTKPWLLLCLLYGNVCIWNYETRTEEKSFSVTYELYQFSKFIPEKHWIVAGCSDGFVRIFDYNTSEKLKEFKAHEHFMVYMDVHPTLPYVFTTSETLIKTWNWENDWESVQTFAEHLNVTKVAFNPKNSSSFVSVSAYGTIKVWDFGSSVAKFTIDAHAKLMNCVEYFVGNDNKLYLLTGSHDYTARVWDFDSKSLVQTLEGHSNIIMATLVHPVLPIIITGSNDETIRIWNKNTYRLELVWSCDFGRIWSIGFIKASNEVILCCDDGFLIIKIVDAGTPSD